MLQASAVAFAGAPVKQTIYTGGAPARHVLVALYNCKDGSLVAGPVTTSDDGTANFASVTDGDYCERMDVPPGFASRQVHIDTTIQNQRLDLTETVPAVSNTDRLFVGMSCLFTFLLVAYPIGRYLAKPWAFRRDTLIAQLSGASMKRYYEQFRRGECIPVESEQKDPRGKKKIALKPVGDDSLNDDHYYQAFQKHFAKWYGRRYYIAPLIGLFTLTAMCCVWGYIHLLEWVPGTRDIESMTGLVAAAIGGALVWVISDEIDRLRRRDFTSSDVYYYVFRLLLAVPFAWALTRLQMTLQVGIPVAFFLGAFPTSTLFTIARRTANQQLKLGDDPATGQLDLEKLESVGKVTAERFRDEGISTVSQLAYADPVDLTIRTNFDFNYVTDCTNQALLWLYLGDKMPLLEIYSLRGGYEAHSLLEALKKGGTAQTNAQKTLDDAAALLTAKGTPISSESLQTSLHQAAYDPYTLFLVDIWK